MKNIQKHIYMIHSIWTSSVFFCVCVILRVFVTDMCISMFIKKKHIYYTFTCV